MSPLRPASILLLAALIAGCGDSAPDAPAPAAPAAKAPAKIASASAPGGGLRVTPTDLHLGDATVTDHNGLRQLPRTRVPGVSGPQQGVGSGAGCQDTDVVPSVSNLPIVVASTLCLLNGERADAGLKALAQDPELARAAASHSGEMVARQYFDHTGKDGSDPVDRIRATGYIPSSGTWTVGENLAWGTGTLATPKAIVAAWMKSQGHRENILRPAFRQIGFGVVEGNPRSRDGSGATFTTAFGAVSGSAGRVSATAGTSGKASSKASRKRRKAHAARKTRRARIASRRR